MANKDYADIQNNTLDLEQNKFGADSDGKVIVKTLVKNLPITPGTDFDSIQATYPIDTQEVYEYYLGAALVRTVTVTYLTSDKRDISTVVYT